jgi:L-threonylcarbamoyladenylate synthase
MQVIERSVIKVKSETLLPDDLNTCVETLRTGGLVVFPTDTVYGVGCNAFNVDAVQKIYALKGRRYSKALPILLSNADQLSLVTDEVLPEAHKLVKAFWPGALTLVFKTAPMVMHATRGKKTIAVRVPDHGVVTQMLAAFGFPLASTSANFSGKPSAKNFSDIKTIFKSDEALLIDGGRCAKARESTVVDVTHFPFTVLREGAIPKDKILAALH